MGVERGGEQHEAAIAHILKAAKDAGKQAAIFCTWSLRFLCIQAFSLILFIIPPLFTSFGHSYLPAQPSFTARSHLLNIQCNAQNANNPRTQKAPAATTPKSARTRASTWYQSSPTAACSARACLPSSTRRRRRARARLRGGIDPTARDEGKINRG